MTPTTHLRFVMRNAMRILQQWWTHGNGEMSNWSPDGFAGEWRDVPLEEAP
jgi:hypothetical protein